MNRGALIAISSYLLAVVVWAQENGPRRLENPQTITLPGGSRVEFHSFLSRTIGEEARFSIFLPPAYEREPSRRFPAIYFLHGLWNDHTSWVVERYGGIPAQLEGLMVNGTIPQCLVVFPDGGNSFYTDYLDGSKRYEELIVFELPTHLEEKYRALPEPGSRSIGGVSMGGYGALKIGLKHPDRYGAVAGVSPIILTGDDPSTYLRDASNRLAQYLVTVLEPVFGIPFDPVHWRNNSVEQLAASASSGSLKVFIGYGTADRYNDYFPLENNLRSVGDSLQRRGVELKLERYENGPHGWQLVVQHLGEIASFLTQDFDR
jgi:S-formylglutathione hydrolase FrmB